MPAPTAAAAVSAIHEAGVVAERALQLTLNACPLNARSMPPGPSWPTSMLIMSEVDPLPGVTLNAVCTSCMFGLDAVTTTHCTPVGTVVSAISTSTTSPPPPPLTPAAGAPSTGASQAANN